MIAYKNNTQLFSYSILFIALFSVLPYPSGIDIFKYINITALMWLIMVVFFIAYFELAKNKLNSYQLRFVKYYLFWNIIMFIVGLFVANGYWEFKVLIFNSFATFLSIATYILIEPYYTQKILSVYFRNIIWITIPFLFLVAPGAYGFFLSPFMLLLLLVPFLDSKWKVITVIITILVIFANLDTRSNLIKYGVAAIISISYYLGLHIKLNWLNLIHKIFMIAPFLILLTAIAGIFNPFKMDSYIKDDFSTEITRSDGQIVKADLKVDTRTGIYKEVFETAKYYNTWITGRSPAKGNRTELFSDIKTITGTAERSGNEVAILNIFTWTGLIGVFLYLLIFYRASWLAINKSNSYFMKLLGIFLSFRWLYSWIEDVNVYSINYFLIWIMLAMAYSDKFRMMNEQELLLWTRGLFYKRYKMGNINKLEEFKKKNEDSRTHNLP